MDPGGRSAGSRSRVLSHPRSGRELALSESSPAADKAYDRIAGIYDALGWLYTGGAIGRLERQQTAHLTPGDHVLYAGVGTGREVPRALEAGAEVTVLDASRVMLQRCQRRLGPRRARVRFCHEDILAHHPSQPYDLVVANFFLNVFSTSTMPKVLRHLATLLRPRGRLAVGDFAPPSDNLLERLLQRAYYLSPLILFSVLTKNPWHSLYDYRTLAPEASLAPLASNSVRIFGIGPSWLATLWFETHGDE